MERMSALDAGFYFAESRNTPLHIASVSVFEGPPPSYGEVVRTVAAKLPDLPRYRQRVRTVPLNLGTPAWMDDEHFQLLYHIRHTALPSPGSPDQLRNLAGRILSQRLDLTRPLWEIWLVEGLEDDQWAVVTKVHHCVVDGIGGVDLMTTLLDIERHPAPKDVPEELPPTAADHPSKLALLADTARTTVTAPLHAIARTPGAVRGIASTSTLRNLGFTLPKAVGRLAEPAASSLNGPVGPHRRWTWVHADLDEVRNIRAGLGGSVNDVILAAVTRGFRDLLEGRGEEPAEDTVVRALVPVSMRAADERGQANNRVSGVLVNLPVGDSDPRRRYFQVRAQMDEIKRTGEAMGGTALTRLAGFAPTLLALGSRAAISGSQPLVQTVVTNVPGPQFPLYALGRKLVGLYPYVPLGLGMRVEVAVFSYLGRFSFGLTGDFDTVPDLAALGEGIQAGFTELSKIASTARRPLRNLARGD